MEQVIYCSVCGIRLEDHEEIMPLCDYCEKVQRRGTAEQFEAHRQRYDFDEAISREL